MRVKATSLAMFGTHVQNVSSVGVLIALSMSARLTGMEVFLGKVDSRRGEEGGTRGEGVRG
ncbi:hypothetical protein AQJ58_26070 [Streptomyces sp. DSM 15324]|nr:hypothetical protein AQJ58_26070 [Streptomyces sp. DSM 15324]